MPYALRSNQYDVIDRLMNYCQDKHGLLIYHTMGSGKSMIGISYMANFYNVPKLIIVPKGVEVPWIKDINESKLEVNMRLCSENNKNVCKTSFLTYDELLTISESAFFALTNKAIVCCDEAHLLIDLLKSSTNAAVIRNCFKKAKKLLLFTGTPIQTGLGDLGILINLCAKKRSMPAINAMYTEPPYTNKAFTLTSKFGNSINVIAGSLLTTLTPYYPALAVSASMSIAMPVMFAVGLASSNLLMRGLNLVIKSIDEVNVNYVAEKSKEYISFFDYKFKDEQDRSLIDFPIIFSGRPLRHYFELTEFQTHINYLQQNRQLNTNESYFQIFGDIDFDKENITLDDQTLESFTEDYTGATLKDTKELYLSWIKRGRVLGNLSITHLFFETKTVKPNATMQRNYPKKISSYSRTYQRIKKANDKFYSAEERERCYNNLPSFAKLLGLPYDTAAEREYVFNEIAKLGYDCPKYYAALTEIMQSRQESNFLPVVYTNFDQQGLQTFSAFLTDQGYPHIVIHPDDDPEMRKNLVEIANLPHRKLKYRHIDGKYMPVNADQKYSAQEYQEIIANRIALRKTVVVENKKGESEYGFYKKLVIPGKTEVGKKYLNMDRDETGSQLFAFLNEDVIKQSLTDVDLSKYETFMTDEEKMAIQIINKLNVSQLKYATQNRKEIFQDNELLCSILSCITKLRDRLQVVIDYDLLSLMRQIKENVAKVEEKLKRPDADKIKLRDELEKLNGAVNVKIRILKDLNKKLKDEESKIHRLQDNILRNIATAEQQEYPEYYGNNSIFGIQSNTQQRVETVNSIFGIQTEIDYNRLRENAKLRGDKTQLLYDMLKSKLPPEYAARHFGFTNGVVDETYEVPVCVILHPSIREGIGFDYSPKLIALEVPYGMGTREQIYARVLRSVNAEKRKICYVDGTFTKNSDIAERKPATSYRDYLPGAFFPSDAKTYPWRVNKEIVQLMNGNVTTTFILPEWMQNLTGKLSMDIPIDPRLVYDSTVQQIGKIFTMAEDKVSEIKNELRRLEYEKPTVELNFNEKSYLLRLGILNKGIKMVVNGVSSSTVLGAKSIAAVVKESYGVMVQAFNGIGRMKEEYNKQKATEVFQGTFIDFYFKSKFSKNDADNSIADEAVYFLNKELELFSDQFGKELLKMNDLEIAKACLPRPEKKCGIINYNKEGTLMYHPDDYDKLAQPKDTRSLRSFPIDNDDSCLYRESGIPNYAEFKLDYNLENAHYQKNRQNERQLLQTLENQIAQEQEEDFFDANLTELQQERSQRQQVQRRANEQSQRRAFEQSQRRANQQAEKQVQRLTVQPQVPLLRSIRFQTPQPQSQQLKLRSTRNQSLSPVPFKLKLIRPKTRRSNIQIEQEQPQVRRKAKRQDRQDSAYGSQQPQE